MEKSVEGSSHISTDTVTESNQDESKTEVSTSLTPTTTETNVEQKTSLRCNLLFSGFVMVVQTVTWKP